MDKSWEQKIHLGGKYYLTVKICTKDNQGSYLETRGEGKGKGRGYGKGAALDWMETRQDDRG